MAGPGVPLGLPRHPVHRHLGNQRRRDASVVSASTTIGGTRRGDRRSDCSLVEFPNRREGQRNVFIEAAVRTQGAWG